MEIRIADVFLFFWSSHRKEIQVHHGCAPWSPWSAFRVKAFKGEALTQDLENRDAETDWQHGWTLDVAGTYPSRQVERDKTHRKID